MEDNTQVLVYCLQLTVSNMELRLRPLGVTTPEVHTLGLVSVYKYPPMSAPVT